MSTENITSFKYTKTNDVEDVIKKTIEDTWSNGSIRLNVYTVPVSKVKEYQPSNHLTIIK